MIDRIPGRDHTVFTSQYDFYSDCDCHECYWGRLKTNKRLNEMASLERMGGLTYGERQALGDVELV